MAEQTINYGLGKPAPDEFYDVSVPNRNMEIIDSKMKELETKKAEEQDLTTLSNTLSHITDGTAIKEMTLSSGINTVEGQLKSPVNVKRIDGKTVVNIAPLLNSGAWSPPSQAVTYVEDSATKITHTNTTGKFESINARLPAKPSTIYRVSALTGGVGKVKVYTFNSANHANLLLETANPQNVQITTLPDTQTLHVELVNESAVNAVATYENVSITEGTQAQPFVANIKGLTNPTIVNETNGSSLVVPTTLYDGEYVEQSAKGELVKYKKFQEVELKGTESYILHYRGTTHANVRIDNFTPRIKPGSRTVVKYNGTILQKNTNVGQDTAADQVYDPTNDNTGTLFIGIANTDSGWGPNYYPTPEEMKAFSLGWTMYHVESNSYNAPYNGTGTKGWVSTAYKTGMSGAVNHNFTSLPTTTPTAEQIGTWQPYRLIYELDTPVQEIIQPYSDLTLEKDVNSIKVYAGRIVNEFNKPYNYRQASWDRFEINTIQDGLSPLKFNTAKILNVYENGKPSSGWLNELTVQGYVRALRNTHLHNRAAAYTVDYDPLYSWEVTAPIDTLQIAYFDTLQAVSNELVYDVAKQQDTTRRMLENALNEREGVQGFNLTTINMADGYVTVSKDRNGYVNVNIYFRSGLWNPGTVIAKLPVGYRPGFLRAAVGQITNVSPFSSTGTFAIDTVGNILIAYGTPLIPGQNYTNVNATGNALFKEGN